MADLSMLHGALFPLPTPFTEDGELNLPVLAEMTKFYASAGAHGYFLFGSFGQGPAMTSAERKIALETVLENLDSDIPVVPQVGTADPYTSRDLARHADALGVTGIGLVGPYYYTDRTREELALHMQLVDDAVTAPLFFYNNPAYQGYPLSAEEVKWLSDQTSGFGGVKIAKGSLAEARHYREVVGPDVRLFAPVEDFIEGMTSGVINGTVNPPMCAIPELGFGLMEAIERGDRERAERYNAAVKTYAATVRPLHKEFGLRAPFGVGMRHLGFDMRYPRWPVPEIPADKVAIIEQAIDVARGTVLAQAS